MALTRDIRIKVTSSQFEHIKNDAQNNGYKTISEYIREIILKESDYTTEILTKIFEILKEKK